MVRTFQTHKIRKSEEISSSLWNFTTMPEKGEAVSMKAAVPSCWETYPDTVTYRGRACYERSFTAEGDIRLEFKGVSHTAEVFLDGSLVKKHYNAYTPFDVVITNLAAGISKIPLDHKEVQEAADKAAPLFKKLVTDAVISFGRII